MQNNLITKHFFAKKLLSFAKKKPTWGLQHVHFSLMLNIFLCPPCNLYVITNSKSKGRMIIEILKHYFRDTGSTKAVPSPWDRKEE